MKIFNSKQDWFVINIALIYSEESEEMPPHVRNPFMLKQKMKLVIDINGFKSEYSEQY